MNKYESKYYQTALLMDLALLELLEKKAYEMITVKEVCEKAGVNRSTFYLHYEGMPDLLEESIRYLRGEMRESFEKEQLLETGDIQNCPLEDLILITEEYLVPYLEFVKKNHRIFKAVISQPAVFQVYEVFDKMKEEIFDPIMSRFRIADEWKKYRLAFYMNGVFAIISTWIEGECKEEIGDIVKIIMISINLKAVPNMNIV